MVQGKSAKRGMCNGFGRTSKRRTGFRRTPEMGKHVFRGCLLYTSMPGHKRNFLPDTMKNFYDIDITEITDFDNLHHAEGILKENQQLAASLYGADFTYFLINGSTAGILAAVSACTKRNGKLLMVRNCHKAVYLSLIHIWLKKYFLKM